MNNEYLNMLKEVNKLMVEKMQLQERIDKAVEYINKYKFKGCESIKERYLDDVLSEVLIEILKGVE